MTIGQWMIKNHETTLGVDDNEADLQFLLQYQLLYKNLKLHFILLILIGNKCHKSIL